MLIYCSSSYTSQDSGIWIDDCIRQNIYIHSITFWFEDWHLTTTFVVSKFRHTLVITRSHDSGREYMSPDLIVVPIFFSFQINRKFFFNFTVWPCICLYPNSVILLSFPQSILNKWLRLELGQHTWRCWKRALKNLKLIFFIFLLPNLVFFT